MTEEQALRQAIKRLAKENEKLKRELASLATDNLVREICIAQAVSKMGYPKKAGIMA